MTAAAEEGSSGISHYVCRAAITKGKAICQLIQFLQEPLDGFAVNLVGQKMVSFFGENGRCTLRCLVEKELYPKPAMPGRR